MSSSHLPHRPAETASGAETWSVPRRSDRLPLHQLETALLTVTVFHLCFLTWALGTMHSWSQFASCGLSMIGLILACIPRASPYPGSPSFQHWPGDRLAGFPVAWLGLVMLAYLGVQSVNPAWRYASNEEFWWLEPLDWIRWLPAGIAAPYELSSVGKNIVVYASLWMLVCSIWVGFNRRRMLLLLCSVLVANACALAIVGALQQISETDRIFWRYWPTNHGFVASFIYPNHGSAYFNLIVALALGLSAWHARRAERGSGGFLGARVMMGSALLVATPVFYSYSRTSIALLAMLVATWTGVGLWRRARRPPLAMKRATAIGAIALLIVGLAGVILGVTRLPDQSTEVADSWAASASASWRERAMVREASYAMFQDRWLLGWGAGAFRHGFPLYAQHTPSIYENEKGVRRFWEHAHCDVIEFAIEFGVLGSLPLVAILAMGALELIRRRFWRHPLALPVVIAGVLLLAHAWVDFVFRNPAILLTWATVLVGAIRWLRLESPTADADA